LVPQGTPPRPSTSARLGAPRRSARFMPMMCAFQRARSRPRVVGGGSAGRAPPPKASPQAVRTRSLVTARDRRWRVASMRRFRRCLCMAQSQSGAALGHVLTPHQSSFLQVIVAFSEAPADRRTTVFGRFPTRVQGERQVAGKRRHLQNLNLRVSNTGCVHQGGHGSCSCAVGSRRERARWLG
jgi:hypothetical protein